MTLFWGPLGSTRSNLGISIKYENDLTTGSDEADVGVCVCVCECVCGCVSEWVGGCVCVKL